MLVCTHPLDQRFAFIRPTAGTRQQIVGNWLNPATVMPFLLRGPLVTRSDQMRHQRDVRTRTAVRWILLLLAIGAGILATVLVQN
jgi:hypothetical protein